MSCPESPSEELLTQAICNRIIKTGLHAAYQKPGEIQDYVRYMMALLYLPHEHIPGVFQQLKDQCLADNHLAELTN